MARGHQLLAGLALLASTLLCQAQSAAGVFQVQITLNSADGSAGVGGTCISDALSSQTGATVRVVCNSEQFVDINPTPGRPFLGTHGGAFRYAFGAGSWGLTLYRLELLRDLLGAGTTSSTRVLGPSSASGTLEMLVSF